MLTFSIIQKSQLEGAHRIDAEYYQPEFLQLREKILSIKHVSLGEITQKFRKGIFDIKADTYTEFGVPFIRISNLQNGIINESNIAHISEEANKSESATEVLKDDVVLSKTAYPAASLVVFQRANISQDIIGMSLKQQWRKQIEPPFLVAFLNSKYGILQMQQWFQGNIQMHLALPDAKNIIIPIFPREHQQKIAGLFNDSLEREKESTLLYAQAESLLLEELRLKDNITNEDLSFTINLSDIKSSNRCDAEYFQPKYERVIRKITKPVQLIKNAPSVPAIQSLEQEKQYKYVELSNINTSIGVIDGHSEVIGKEAPSRARRILKKKDIIVSSIQGSLEKAAIVQKEQDGFIASTGFFQFRAKNILPEVLLVLAKSIVLQSQLEKRCAGTILTAVPKETIKELVIPTIGDSAQAKIAGLVRLSHEARKKSKELLDEAKRRVDEMIEKG